jgi:hypothetical protein
MTSTRITAAFSNKDTKLIDGSDLDLIGKVHLESGEMSSLVVGIFEQDFPQPTLHLEVAPNNVAISSWLVRVEDNGEYKLTYHFQNFQDQPCEVTVRRCDS